MDVKLDDEQLQLMRSVKDALDRHRAGTGGVAPWQADVEALAVLGEAGFLDVIEEGGSPVDALLVTEQAAVSAPGAPVGERAFVAPLVAPGRVLDEKVALVERRSGSLSRLAPQAELLLSVVGDEAWVSTPNQVTVQEVHNRWGYPVGRVEVHEGDSQGPGSGQRLLRLWRIALAAEGGALMESATRLVTEHAKHRVQFGRPIGAHQSIQHRLARSYALSQGVRWLARRAAWSPEDDYLAAAAACYAAEGMRETLSAAHQAAGAVGITDEFGLLAYTARMAYLQTELGGAAGHARAVTQARWPAEVVRDIETPVPPIVYRRPDPAGRRHLDDAVPASLGAEA